MGVVIWGILVDLSWPKNAQTGRLLCRSPNHLLQHISVIISSLHHLTGNEFVQGRLVRKVSGPKKKNVQRNFMPHLWTYLYETVVDKRLYLCPKQCIHLSRQAEAYRARERTARLRRPKEEERNAWEVRIISVRKCIFLLILSPGMQRYVHT